MSDYNKFIVYLECSALETDALVVRTMRGREEISRLYTFDIVVTPSNGAPLIDEDLKAIMGGTATLSFGPQREHPVKGVIREIELRPTLDATRISYRFRLVPTLWDTHLTRGSWIYQDLKPADIIKKAFTETLPQASRLTDGDQFDFGSLEGSYVEREYVVQYEESVFNFISRQAEHWGISYHFDHLAEKERIVFGDTNNAFQQLTDFEKIQFVGTSGTDVEECIRKIGSTQRMVPNQLSLREYNYRTPSVPLVSTMQQIDEAGVGDVHVSGSHFWTPSEGGSLTTLRTEEMLANKLKFVAHSRVRGLRAGHRFTLEGGPTEFLGMAREYLVVAVEHDYGTSSEGSSNPYTNRLELIPYEMTYRPARLTRAPKIYGIMHAKVDSAGSDDGVNVPVDEWGRYKVVMPFDVAGETGGKATCWIRLATPSIGESWGMANQLHIGVECAIYHVDGDPDRPVIAAGLPNFENRSVITSSNPNQTVSSSRGGTAFTFSD